MLRPYPKTGKKPKKKPKPIRKVSKKKAKQDREHSALKKLMILANGTRCHCGTPVCTGTVQDLDERLARSQCGSPTDPENTRLTCRAGHQWKQENHAEAVAMGIKATRQVVQQPVQRHKPVTGVIIAEDKIPEIRPSSDALDAVACAVGILVPHRIKNGEGMTQNSIIDAMRYRMAKDVPPCAPPVGDETEEKSLGIAPGTLHKKLSDIALEQLQRIQDEETDRMLRGDYPILNKLLANTPKRNPIPWHKRNKWNLLKYKWSAAVEAWRDA